MIKDELRKALIEYIDQNYVEENEAELCCMSAVPMDIELLKGSAAGAVKKESFSLEQILDEVGESFHEMLFLKIDTSGMTDVEVYKRAHIDRKLFSKIRSNPAYHPRKQTVLALAIALRLNIDETMDLLSRAEYALSPSNKGDLIVRYFIEHGVYDIMEINYALDDFGLDILG